MKQIETTLFGKSKNNKITQWSVYVNGASVIVEYGYVDGKKQLSEYVTTAKNVGKANATTPEEQAEKEAIALWVKQIERNLYRKTVAELDNLILLPMLAHDYTKYPHKLVLPAYTQPKLDGVRALFNNARFLSRKGIEYKMYDCLYDQLSVLFSAVDLPYGLDGELYAHGMYLQQINSLVKNTKKSLSERSAVEYCIFDVPIPGMPFSERNALLNQIAVIIDQFNLTKLKVVKCDWITNVVELEQLQASYVSGGYEGIMIRDPVGEYEYNNRSYSLLKYKKFQEKEFKIIGVEEDKDGQAVFVCLLDDLTDRTFGCKIRGTDEFRVGIIRMKEQYINKWLTVRFQDRTMDYIPTFGVGVNVRECDKNGEPLE